MANTRMLAIEVEDCIREQLAMTFGQPFDKRKLALATGGMHEFDAVSEDGTVVTSIKSAGGKTSGGKHPSGKVNNAIAELYFLMLLDAPRRRLILTSPDFYRIFTRTLAGKIASGIEAVHMPLPPALQVKVIAVQAKASDEVNPVLDKDERRIAATNALAGEQG